MRIIEAKNEQDVRSLKSDYGQYGCLWIPTRDEIFDFAKQYSDFNPIHVDADHARKLGYPDVIAHGLLVLARITYLRPEPDYKIEGVRSRKGIGASIKWRSTIFAGDEVHGRESVADIVYSAARGHFIITFGFEVRVNNRQDQLAGAGTYKVFYQLD